MKRKLLALLMSATMCASTALGLAACGAFGSSPNGGGENGNGVGDGGKDDGGDDKKQEEVVLENADVLAMSCDRLENADLSFNFSMGGAAEKKRVAVSPTRGKARAARVGAREAADGSDDGYVEIAVTPDESPSGMEYRSDFFADYQDQLGGTAGIARQTVNTAVDTMTVLDKAVTYFDGAVRVLSYDSQNDVVKLLTSDSAGAFERKSEISVYYDADGDETVEMWNAMSNGMPSNAWSSYSIDHIVYTADKFYEIESYSYSSPEQGGGEGYHYAAAFKVDGLWRGINYFFRPNNPYYTHQGTYDYANGMLYFDFLSETENIVYTYGEVLVASRAEWGGAGETSSGEPAMETDIIYPRHSTFYAPYIYGNVFVYSYALDGWKKLTVEYNPEYYHSNDEGDILVQGVETATLECDNGVTLTENCAWHEDYGFVESLGGFCYDDGTVINKYETSDGTVLEYDQWDDETVHFGVSYVTVTAGGEYAGKSARYSFTCTGDEKHDSFDRRNKFLEYCGLSWNDEYIDFDYFSEMSEKQRNRDYYVSDIFNRLFGGDFVYDNIRAQYDRLIAELPNKHTELATRMESYESVDAESIPKRPANLALISLSDKLTGTATVSANGIDASGMSVSVPKSVILQKDRQYGLAFVWSGRSGSQTVSGSAATEYGGEGFTLVGSSDVRLPDIRIVGEFKLQAYLCKIDGTSRVRVSEIVDVDVSAFEHFRITAHDENGGYDWSFDFMSRDGAAVLTVDFEDITPPIIDVDGVADGNVVTLPVSSTVSTLLSAVSATDNHDTVVDDFNVKHADDENVLPLGETLGNGEYVITATDAAGNIGTYDITVVIS